MVRSSGWENAVDVSTPTLPSYMRSLTISSFASSCYPLPHLSLYSLSQEGQNCSSTEITIWAEDMTYSPIPQQRHSCMLWKYSTVFTESIKDSWKQLKVSFSYIIFPLKRIYKKNQEGPASWTRLHQFLTLSTPCTPPWSHWDLICMESTFFVTLAHTASLMHLVLFQNS